jgi:hypothetical protein
MPVSPTPIATSPFSLGNRVRAPTRAFWEPGAWITKPSPSQRTQLVTLTFASWNLIESGLRKIGRLKAVFKAVRLTGS